MPQQSKDNNVALGILAMLSGDPVLSNVGKVLSDHGSKLQSMGQGFLLDPDSGDVTQSPEYAKWIKEREAAVGDRWSTRNEGIVDRMVLGNDMRQTNPKYQTVPTEGGQAVVQTNPLAKGGAGVNQTIPITAPLAHSDRQKAAEAERLVNEAHTVHDELTNLPNAVNPAVDIPVSLLRNFSATRGVGNLIAEKSYSPEENRVRDRGARLESDLSKLAAGLALTGFELQDRERWSPFAPGISRQESQNRLENLSDVFTGMRDAVVHAPDVSARAGQQGATAGSAPARARRYNPDTGKLE